jgi:potassium channel subfamily K
MGHLNSSPPRKYSFDEWAWYLKLIGEDESSPETHRKPIRRPKHTSDGPGIVIGRVLDEDKTVKWSWVGKRSPLMGNKEEAEWVLERLTKTLERELEAMRKEEEEGRGDWAPGGRMERMEGMEPMFRDGDGNGGEGPSTESSRTMTRERKDGEEV